MKRVLLPVALASLLLSCLDNVVFADQDKGPPFDYRPLPAMPIRITPMPEEDVTLPQKLIRVQIPNPSPLDGYDSRQDTYILFGNNFEPIVSLAVSTNGEFAGTGIDAPGPPPDALYWSSDIVTRDEWNAGFPMPHFGPWDMPHTATLNFDTFFGPAATQVALYWAGEESSNPLGIGESYWSFFAGRSTGHDPGPPAQWLAFGPSGAIVAGGVTIAATLVPEPGSAILLTLAFAMAAVVARRAHYRH